MSTYVVWVEMNEAKIFKIEVDGALARVIRRHEVKHHTNSDPKNHKDCEKFFHEVSESIRDASEILLVGAGLAKEHFKAHLLRHHHQNLADKVVGMETADRISDARILELARKFFKRLDLLGPEFEQRTVVAR